MDKSSIIIPNDSCTPIFRIEYRNSIIYQYGRTPIYATYKDSVVDYMIFYKEMEFGILTCCGTINKSLVSICDIY